MMRTKLFLTGIAALFLATGVKGGRIYRVKISKERSACKRSPRCSKMGSPGLQTGEQ